jgi:hypothetical protein
VIPALAARTASVVVGGCFGCGAFAAVPAAGIIGSPCVGEPRSMGCIVIGPVDIGFLLGILNTVSRSRSQGRPFRAAFLQWRLLAEVSATVFAAEHGSRLTDEAIAPGISVIVAVAVIVGIWTAERWCRNGGRCSDHGSRDTSGGINWSTFAVTVVVSVIDLLCHRWRDHDGWKHCGRGKKFQCGHQISPLEVWGANNLRGETFRY